MRKFLISALLASCALLFGQADVRAQGGYYGMIDNGGFDAVVCSSFVNNVTTGGYRLLSLPTGMDMFRLIRIVPVAPDAGQTIELRFWPSTTDSSNNLEPVGWATTTDGELYNQYFPRNCQKISVSLIDGTDDFLIEAYCTRKGSDYGTRGNRIYDMVRQYNFDDNAGALGTYEKILPETGCKWIRMVRLIPLAPGAAQSCGLRFWKTSADSTGGIVYPNWAQTVDGEPYNQYFPVNCRAISVSLADATDDFYVQVYSTYK